MGAPQLTRLAKAASSAPSRPLRSTEKDVWCGLPFLSVQVDVMRKSPALAPWVHTNRMPAACVVLVRSKRPATLPPRLPALGRPMSLAALSAAFLAFSGPPNLPEAKYLLWPVPPPLMRS